ncbi:MAG: thymidine phosphorylase family protein [archaeon]
MELKVKILKWSTGFPVAMLNQKTADEIGVNMGDRISIKSLSKGSKEISTITNSVIRLVGKQEIAVSSELKERLDLKQGEKVEINLSTAPDSLKYIKQKLNGGNFSKKQIDEIIKDIVENSLSEAEIALFVSAMYKTGMSMKETIYLIDAIVKSGNKLNLKNKMIVDKHSIGGVPGNRTTPIIVSICAASGLTIPKSSSRAITSAAGTADVIETIAKVEFSIKELKKIVLKTNACMIWGGSLGIVPADSRIIRVEKMLKIDPEAQLLASIMSKKIAAGSKYILIDIPYGKNAKVNKSKALRLKKKFEYLGKHYHKKLKVVLTDGNQPIGNGIGPALELIDVINILNPRKQGPKDLEKRSLYLAGQILEMAGKAKKQKGIDKAREILNSGKAFEKFKQIIQAQGGKLNGLAPGKFKYHIIAKKSGKIKEIFNNEISSLARIAGCPVDKSSGIYLYFHIGDKIKKGDKILTIYSESRFRIKEAILFYKKEKPIIIK